LGALLLAADPEPANEPVVDVEFAAECIDPKSPYDPVKLPFTDDEPYMALALRQI
jgi:hypothetical protein